MGVFNFNNMEGWIKLHRALLNSFVFAHPTTLKIWVWLLLKANHRHKYTVCKVGFGFQDIELQPGQLKFGRAEAEEELCINGNTIYKHLHKLKDAGNILIESNNHFSIITICNWETYQSENGTEITAKEQHGNNSQVTTRKSIEFNETIEDKLSTDYLEKEQPSNNRVTTEQQQSNTYNNDNNVKNNIYSDFSIFFDWIKNEKFFKPIYLKNLESIFNELIENGYSTEDIKMAIVNAHNNEFYRTIFLTPEMLLQTNKNKAFYIDIFLQITNNGLTENEIEEKRSFYANEIKNMHRDPKINESYIKLTREIIDGKYQFFLRFKEQLRFKQYNELLNIRSKAGEFGIYENIKNIVEFPKKYKELTSIYDAILMNINKNRNDSEDNSEY